MTNNQRFDGFPVSIDRDFLVNLRILDHQSNGQAALPPDTRPDLEEYISWILLDRTALAHHLEMLATIGVPIRFRDTSPLEADRLSEALEEGVAILSDADLVKLTLSPSAAVELADRIDLLMPESWIDDMISAGARRALLEGVSFSKPLPIPSPLPVETIPGPSPFIASISMRFEASSPGLEAIPMVGSLELGRSHEPTTPQEEDQPQRTWHLEVPASAFTRVEGAPGELAGGVTGTVSLDIDWYTAGRLEVWMRGALIMGTGYTLEIVWFDGDGSERAHGSISGKFGGVTLVVQTGMKPMPGDQLRITHTRHTQDGKSWSLQGVINISP